MSDQLREALETWAHWDTSVPGFNKVGRDMSDSTTKSDSTSRSLLREALKLRSVASSEDSTHRLIAVVELEAIVAAARKWLAVEEAEPIQWCEEHKSRRVAGEAWCYVAALRDCLGSVTLDPANCSIVPKFLVSTEGET